VTRAWPRAVPHDHKGRARYDWRADSILRGSVMEPRTLACDSRGEGEPLVLLPGGLTGWLSWIPHQERLARRYRAIRVQPIHNELGSAGVPGDPTYDSHTERESLRLTLEALGLGSVHLAGWSGGGGAALEYATEYPSHVRSLTLVEPGTSWVLEQLGERLEEIRAEDAFMYALTGREVSEEDLAEFLVLAGLANSPEAVRSDPAWERWVDHRMALSWRSERLDRPPRSLDDLSRITCPALLVKGTDTTPLLQRIVDVLGDYLSHASVLELEGDHACHIQSIDAFLAAFERHVDSVAGDRLA
jgi:pimeloyl-ACP methyl ester carboxylesterase